MSHIRGRDRAEHTCHAAGCTAHVHPSMFMCKRHWFMVPKKLRDEVWNEYVPGQEQFEVAPTEGYFSVTREAIRVVAEKEGRFADAANKPDEETLWRLGEK